MSARLPPDGALVTPGRLGPRLRGRGPIDISELVWVSHGHHLTFMVRPRSAIGKGSVRSWEHHDASTDRSSRSCHDVRRGSSRVR
jgi:hypothetical protein